ncbi:hypothetical protein HRJ34_15465 [Rhizorhabdus wittichii]|jgi:hypothetical protein|uniref:Uncharacterized protein n=1 Tax=Rhizorhabdus wittichii TaxID=160791 RepID=A0A975D065_9SPHN|nr:hypothetical protein [Rhizorhabdus wittichii]QTH19766.1 hypothetical protein HRJ34_15465 [Rhizorhabdus wittichii]
MTSADKVTALLSAILICGIVFALFRFAIPALVNTQTDAGLIGAGITALFAIGLAATALLKAGELLGLTEGSSDE